MSALHPKRRVYAALDEWLQGGGNIPSKYAPVNWLLDVLMWEDDLDDIPHDDQRRYVESWLRVNIVPETPSRGKEETFPFEDNNWEF